MKQDTKYEGYESSLEHLLDELRRIHLMIQRRVIEFQLERHDPTDHFMGLAIN